MAGSRRRASKGSRKGGKGGKKGAKGKATSFTITDSNGPLWVDAALTPKIGKIGYTHNGKAGKGVKNIDGVDPAVTQAAFTGVQTAIIVGPYNQQGAAYDAVTCAYLHGAKAAGVKRVVLQSFCHAGGRDAFSKSLANSQALARTFPEFVIVNIPHVPELDNEDLAAAETAGRFWAYGKPTASYAYTTRGDVQKALFAAAKLPAADPRLGFAYEVIGGVHTNQEVAAALTTYFGKPIAHVEYTNAEARTLGDEYVAYCEHNTRLAVTDHFTRLTGLAPTGYVASLPARKKGRKGKKGSAKKPRGGSTSSASESEADSGYSDESGYSGESGDSGDEEYSEY